MASAAHPGRPFAAPAVSLLPAGTRGPRLLEARFVDRPNRFLVRCRLPGGGGAGAEGPVVEAHLPDPGRLRELLVPGRRVWLRPEGKPGAGGGPPGENATERGRRSSRATAPRGPGHPPRGRKTAYTAVLVETPDGEGLVSVDTTVPNRLVAHALEAGGLEELAGWEVERREAPLGGSRIDFLLREAGRRLALEVKSVTLVEEGVGLFPDAVTARGARHVRELAALARREGWEAAVLFLAQRDDVERIVAAREIDPTFAGALAEARGAGVHVLGRRCRVSLDRVELGEAIPAG